MFRQDRLKPTAGRKRTVNPNWDPPAPERKNHTTSWHPPGRAGSKAGGESATGESRSLSPRDGANGGAKETRPEKKSWKKPEGSQIQASRSNNLIPAKVVTASCDKGNLLPTKKQG